MECSQLTRSAMREDQLRLVQAIACVAFVFVCFLVFAANVGWGEHFSYLVATMPGKDKTIHFLVFGTLAMLMSFAMRLFAAEFGRLRIFHGVLLILCLSTIEEFSQLCLINRTFDWLDLLSNYSGILFFGFVTRFVALRSGWLSKAS